MNYIFVIPVRLIHADPMLMLNPQGKPAHEVQSSTLELINGLVSLVQNPTIPDVSNEAMDALLVLHQPEKIEMWNPEAPINTFWDLSSQVFSVFHEPKNFVKLIYLISRVFFCPRLFLNSNIFNFTSFIIFLFFSGVVFHEPKIDPAFNCQLHGRFEMVENYFGMSKSVFEKTSRICQRGISNCHLSTSSYQTRSCFIYVFMEY